MSAFPTIKSMDEAPIVTEIARCVVAGGNGQVGGMFTALLVDSGVSVTSVDTDLPATGDEIPRVRYERGDITALRGQVAREVAQVDLVLLAVPERVALAAVAPLTATMRRGALLADTLSVKSRIANLVRGEVRHVEVLSLNPMFHPSLGMAGRPVAVSTLVDGPRARALQKLLSSWGARVVPVGADEHDRLTAAMQAATHGAALAFGFALQELGPDVEDLCALAPPPHLTLLAMLARIASGVPEVYWDIQTGNPQAPAALAALRRGVDRLVGLANGEDEASFAASLNEVQVLLGGNLAPLSDICARMFEELPPAPGAEDDSEG
ncbi:MAG: 4-amino-4-deoxyprephenate dehydrogenase [Rubrobacteraceae bacterium]|nr:4-amino-4-deoxyprephenate dehydrogenase [Rubrobacteraceae bacterium]